MVGHENAKMHSIILFNTPSQFKKSNRLDYYEFKFKHWLGVVMSSILRNNYFSIYFINFLSHFVWPPGCLFWCRLEYIQLIFFVLS